MKYVPGGKNSQTKKSLGQHWLHDINILEAVAESADIAQGDEILEIGPGLGTLTDVLVKNGAKILALEFDQDLIGKLNKKFSNSEHVKIVEGDVRTFDFNKMPKKYKIVANIPYYLTSNLIRSISETSNPPEVASLLIQKEVAERICALPGQMGILSVTAQFYFECSLSVEVPAELFTPPPKVDSQVVVLKHRTRPLFDVDVQRFFALVKAGFSEKRKALRNSLSGGLNISKQDAEALLAKANISLQQRAQQLALEDWHKLYEAYNTV